MEVPPSQPPGYSPAARPGPGGPGLFTLSLGLGGAYTSGDVGGTMGRTDDWWPGFTLFQLEAGMRVTPATTVLLYLDGGGGDAAKGLRDECAARRYDCGTGSVRFGLSVRYAFTPFGPATPWVSAGTGWESTGLTIDGPAGSETIAFEGWEALKLGAGYDLRLTRWFGLGAFAGFSLATYSSVRVDGPDAPYLYLDPGSLGGQRLHVWGQLGVKAILFP
jgi:hypothetical protein